MNIKRFGITLLLITILCSPVFADLDDTLRKTIPSEYYKKIEQRGRTEPFFYQVGTSTHKTVVYLPYGYNENDKSTRYPVLYLMHGGGGGEGSYLGPASTPNSLANIIDNLIYNKQIKPLIIVCPKHAMNFHTEMRKYLIPEIDSKYNTIADRENRAVGGFSMGGVETWGEFNHNLDLIKYYMPMSGDSWIAGSTGGKIYADLTSRLLSRSSFISDYDYYIFAATGDRDGAYANMTPQIQAMKNYPEVFKYTTGDFSKGNFIYYVAPNHMHDYAQTYEYIFNGLPLFYPVK